jgi:hypothetical protein
MKVFSSMILFVPFIILVATMYGETVDSKVVIESHERVSRSLKEGVTVLTAKEQLESENKNKLDDRRLLPI